MVWIGLSTPLRTQHTSYARQRRIKPVAVPHAAGEFASYLKARISAVRQIALASGRVEDYDAAHVEANYDHFFRKSAAVEGSVGAEIDPRVLVPANSPLVSKAKADAFTNPALLGILARAGIRQLVILGVYAEGCVLATATSAVRRGFSVTVICDGVGSKRDILRDSGLLKMQEAGVRLKECSEIVG